MPSSSTSSAIIWILAATQVAEDAATGIARAAGYRVHVLREAYGSSATAGGSDGSRTILLDFEDPSALQAAATRALALTGRPDRILPMDEYGILAAAQLRQDFHVMGPRVAQVRAVRDKRVMHALVQRAGIPTTRRITPAELADWDFGNAVVAKPASGAGSEGVRRLSSANDPVGEDDVVEAWQSGTPGHVDGVSVGGEVTFAVASTYGQGTCFAFAQGEPLTSRTLHGDDPEAELMIEQARRVVRALSLPDGAFHCEFFVDDGEVVFLEIGARPGGGFIVEAVEAATGVDLRDEHVRASLGLGPESTSTRQRAAGFWLLPVPPGHDPDDVVRETTSHPILRSEVLMRQIPHVGVPLRMPDDYREALAYFVLVADDAAAVRGDLDRLTETVVVR